MSSADEPGVSFEEFRLMAERAGLGMTVQELEDLKPLYDLYAQYTEILHSIDFGAEEIGMTFHPDWPPAPLA
jgi:hypothetical protein